MIRGSNFVNEDGNSNAAVRDVANWLNYYLVDQSNTGTGLDKIVDAIQNDQVWVVGFIQDINEGARCANELKSAAAIDDVSRLRTLHFPSDMLALRAARRRLAFEGLFYDKIVRWFRLRFTKGLIHSL